MIDSSNISNRKLSLFRRDLEQFTNNSDEENENEVEFLTEKQFLQQVYGIHKVLKKTIHLSLASNLFH